MFFTYMLLKMNTLTMESKPYETPMILPTPMSMKM